GLIRPRADHVQFQSSAQVDLVAWKYAIPTSIVFLSCIGFRYILFSPIGLAYAYGIVSPWFWPSTISLIVLTIILFSISVKSWNAKYTDVVAKNYAEAAEKSTPIKNV